MQNKVGILISLITGTLGNWVSWLTDSNLLQLGLPGGSAVNYPPAIQEMQEMQVQSSGQEDPLEGNMGNPLQCSCLENPVDRETWQTTVHRVAKSQTKLKQFSTHTAPTAPNLTVN